MEVMDRHTATTTKDPARIGTPHNVRLDEAEQAAHERYNLALDAAASVTDAASYALAGMLPRHRSQEFVDWLSDGTLRMMSDRRVVKVATPITKRPILNPDGYATGSKQTPVRNGGA